MEMRDEKILAPEKLENNVEPLRYSLRLMVPPARAFRAFTEEMDSWWPRSHHIGSSPMKRVVVEGKPGGSIYTDHEDGEVSLWGYVVVWEPPLRFVMLWKINPEWGYEADVTKCSEVEVTFTAFDDGGTLVELEHRGLERHGGAFTKMRAMVNGEGGWGSILRLFAAHADEGKHSA